MSQEREQVEEKKVLKKKRPHIWDSSQKDRLPVYKAWTP